MIEAFRLITGAQVPDWLWTAMHDGRVKAAEPNPPLNDWARGGLLIVMKYAETMRTTHSPALPGDWIIRTEDGDLFAVKAVDFELTYFTPKLQGKRADLVILDELDP